MFQIDCSIEYAETVSMTSLKSGVRDAPPTRNPSMSDYLMSSLQFLALTEPP